MGVTSQLFTLMGKHKYMIMDVHLKTGLTQSTISNLYNDKATRIDYDTVSSLSDLFNCEISEILSLEKENDIVKRMEVHNEYDC